MRQDKIDYETALEELEFNWWIAIEENSGKYKASIRGDNIVIKLSWQSLLKEIVEYKFGCFFGA